MERVSGMPVRCVITKKVIDEKWKDKVFEPGKVIELYGDEFDLFNNQHPGCIQEIEMTEEDWIDLATSHALDCKKRISELERLYGEEFSSYNISVIPPDGLKVVVDSFAGGLSDAYSHTKRLQEDVENFEKKFNNKQFNNSVATNSSNMHRVVIKVKIDDDRLLKPIKAGEELLNQSDFEWLKTNYPDSFVEIQMNEKECLQYLSDEVHKSYEKAKKLQTICEQFGLDVNLPVAFNERTSSLHRVATEGGLLNPKFYGGGLKDVLGKAWSYKRDVDEYEENVFSKLNKNSKTI